MQMRTLALVFTLPFAAFGCNDAKTAACSSSSDCPEGNVCLADRCERLCDSSNPCPSGFACDTSAGDAGGICISSSLVPPSITAVSGSGTSACVNDTGTTCIGTGFLVSGTFSDDTSFQLIGPAESTTQRRELPSTVARVDATSVKVVPTLPSTIADLPAGTYTLLAVNQAGEDASDIQLLQGEPGEPGAPGPDATGDEIISRINSASGLINAARVDGGGGNGGGEGSTTFIYDNAATATEDRNTGDRMVVTLNGGPTIDSIAIDHTKLQDLCADLDGCNLTLGVTRIRPPTLPGQILNTPISGGTCRFYYDSTNGHWSIDDPCARWVREADKTSGDAIGGYPLAGYNSRSAFAFDGDAEAIDLAGAFVAIGFNGFCYMSEAPPDTASTTGEFLSDDSRGFFLVAGAETFSPGDYDEVVLPSSDTERECVLIIED